MASTETKQPSWKTGHLSVRLWLGHRGINTNFYAFCHGREDVTAWLCTILPKTNSGCNKQTHFTCLRWDGVLIRLIRFKRVWSRLFSYISARSDRRTPAIAIEMKSAHRQWRRWRNLAFLEIMWCETRDDGSSIPILQWKHNMQFLAEDTTRAGADPGLWNRRGVEWKYSLNWVKF
jgi:hypothetical protein